MIVLLKSVELAKTRSKLDEALLDLDSFIGQGRMQGMQGRVVWKTFTEKTGILEPEKLGFGAFADVFQHPKDKNKVVKLVVSPDRCWLKYVNFIEKNSSKEISKYMPKIYDKNVDNKRERGAFIMEKLYPWNLTRLRKIMKTDPYPLVFLYNRFKNILSPEDMMMGNLIDVGAAELSNTTRWITKKTGKLPPFLVLINKLKKDCRLDLHQGNIMFRKNGELVLNDPVILAA